MLGASIKHLFKANCAVSAQFSVFQVEKWLQLHQSKLKLALCSALAPFLFHPKQEWCGWDKAKALISGSLRATCCCGPGIQLCSLQ